MMPIPSQIYRSQMDTSKQIPVLISHMVALTTVGKRLAGSVSSF